MTYQFVARCSTSELTVGDSWKLCHESKFVWQIMSGRHFGFFPIALEQVTKALTDYKFNSYLSCLQAEKTAVERDNYVQFVS